MTNVDILAACIAAREGVSVAEQFRDWAEHDNFDEQNPNAMKACLLVLNHIARGSSDMAQQAQQWAEHLDGDIWESKES